MDCFIIFIFQDPKRTRELKRRKLVSMKRRRAYDRRQEKQQHKESELFKSVQSNFSSPNKKVCKYMTRKVKEIKPILPDMLREIPIWPYRLRGGADRQDTNEVNIELRRINFYIRHCY